MLYYSRDPADDSNWKPPNSRFQGVLPSLVGSLGLPEFVNTEDFANEVRQSLVSLGYIKENASAEEVADALCRWAKDKGIEKQTGACGPFQTGGNAVLVEPSLLQELRKAVANPQQTSTRSKWLIPALVGGGVLVAGGIVFALIRKRR